MTTRLDRVWPDPAENLSDDDILDASPALRVNFVSSIDGAATHDGLSGGLSDSADKRRFELLRRACDVVLVGAGTARAEGYGPMRVSEASARWRRSNGMPEHPVFALVSGRLDLDPASPIFTDAPVRPIVITARGRETTAFAADVIATGEERVDLADAVSLLRARGLTRILCEGGPSLFASLLAVDLVDELCLTIAPTLESGDSGRITHAEAPTPRGMHLARVLRSGDTLLLTYRR